MTAVPPPAMPATPAMPVRPRAVNGLGTTVTVLLVGSVVLVTLLVASSWADYARVAEHVSGRLSEDAFWEQHYGSLTFLIVSLLVAFPTFIGSMVALLVWVHRARTNAGLLSPHHPFRFSPAFSVGGLLVPLANLWWCRPIFEDICIGSGIGGQSVRLVRTWWITILTATVVSVIGSAVIPVPTLTYTPDGQLVSGGEEALDTFLATALFDTVLIAMELASVAMLAMIVRRVSRRQTELLFASQPV